MKREMMEVRAEDRSKCYGGGQQEATMILSDGERNAHLERERHKHDRGTERERQRDRASDRERNAREMVGKQDEGGRGGAEHASE